MLLVVLLFLLNSTSYCLGILTDFNNIFVENLQIGNEYNLTQLVNLPLRVKNLSKQKVKIRIQPISPSSISLKEGFEAVPSTCWVVIKNPDFWVEPDSFGISDVVIKIPNDKSLCGRKFQVNIWCYVDATEITDTLLMVTPGVEGRFFFSISENVSRQKIKPVDIDFEVEPKEFNIIVSSTKMVLGSIRIRNNSKRDFVYHLNQVDPDKVNITLKQGYNKLPVGSLCFVPQQLKIKSKKTAESLIELCIDEMIEYQKKYFAVVEVQVLGKGISASKYIKIFIEVKL